VQDCGIYSVVVVNYRNYVTWCDGEIFSSPTSDNLTPQETTKDDPSDRGQDGPSLSCPGSSVVADQASEDDE
jgi:hypothetical protein